jgi:hypothetical protein
MSAAGEYPPAKETASDPHTGKRPRIDERGEIVLQSVEEMTKNDLHDWMADRLAGRDTDVPLDPRGGALPHYAFVTLSKRLGASAQKNLALAVELRLNQLVSNPGNFSTNEADYLLQLAPRIVVSDPGVERRAEQALEKVLGALHPAPLTEWPGDDDRHGLLSIRALQGMVLLRSSKPAEFWQRQAAERGPLFISLMFEAQCVNEPEEALRWLATLDWSTHVPATCLDNMLPSLLRSYSRPKLEGWITALLLPVLDPASRAAVEKICADNGVPLDRETAPVQAGKYRDLHAHGLLTPDVILMQSGRLRRLAEKARLALAEEFARSVRLGVPEDRQRSLEHDGTEKLRLLINNLSAEDNMRLSLLDPTINYVLTSRSWFWSRIGDSLTVVNDDCIIFAVTLMQERSAHPPERGPSDPPVARHIERSVETMHPW